MSPHPGNESSVERLLKQIGTFMSDIADEFKIVVVEAIRSLCLKFPQKYRALMNFLSNVRSAVTALLRCSVMESVANSIHIPIAWRRSVKDHCKPQQAQRYHCQQALQ